MIRKMTVNRKTYKATIGNGVRRNSGMTGFLAAASLAGEKSTTARYRLAHAQKIGLSILDLMIVNGIGKKSK